jgi:hypothetical protein
MNDREAAVVEDSPDAWVPATEFAVTARQMEHRLAEEVPWVAEQVAQAEARQARMRMRLLSPCPMAWDRQHRPVEYDDGAWRCAHCPTVFRPATP